MQRATTVPTDRGYFVVERKIGRVHKKIKVHTGKFDFTAPKVNSRYLIKTSLRFLFDASSNYEKRNVLFQLGGA